MDLTQAKQQWKDLGYGMFLHFGVNTFAGTGWGDGSFPAAGFAPDRLDFDQWADMAAAAGMKYAVLTAKHHDGFCLWDTAYSDYCIRNAGVGTDVVAGFVKAFRAAGLKTGLYYSLWDRHCPYYQDDDRYAQYMINQLGELLQNYGEILELWFDGGWDKDYPSRSWDYQERPGEVIDGSRWHWSRVYEYIHQMQAPCLVIQNSSSNRPGKIKYPPQDVSTVEQYNFVYRNQLCEFDPESYFDPVEFCTTLPPDWFFIDNRFYPHPSAECIAHWRATANAYGGNLLLNVGPDKTGRIPEFHRNFLVNANRLYQNTKKQEVYHEKNCRIHTY